MKQIIVMRKDLDMPLGKQIAQGAHASQLAILHCRSTEQVEHWYHAWMAGPFGLFLCGYFDSGYLGYEAAEGIDWVWEHRIDDLAKFEL